MANRHSHKKLRLHVRRRMAATGESYQKALCEVLQLGDDTRDSSRGVDLIIAHYFGVPITLATFEAVEPLGHPVITWVPSSLPNGACPLPSLPLAVFGSTGVQ
jgi:hypothetical protein